MVKKFQQHNVSGKKGQIGTSISWFVATIVVAVILIIFVGISTLDSLGKIIKGKTTEIKSIDSDIFFRLKQQRNIQMFFRTDYQERNSFDVLKSFDVKQNIIEASRYQTNYREFLEQKCLRENCEGIYYLEYPYKLIETSHSPYLIPSKDWSMKSTDWYMLYVPVGNCITKCRSEKKI